MSLLDAVIKTRLRRLLFSVLMPPVTGGVILALIDVWQAGTFANYWTTVLTIIFFGYVFMGLQSLVTGLILEFIVLRFASRQFQVIISSALLGTLAGATLAWMSPIFILTGAIVGLMVGLVYQRCI